LSHIRRRTPSLRTEKATESAAGEAVGETLVSKPTADGVIVTTPTFAQLASLGKPG
jgi:hypothetical protein